jgi:hypothetical protein
MKSIIQDSETLTRYLDNHYRQQKTTIMETIEHVRTLQAVKEKIEVPS